MNEDRPLTWAPQPLSLTLDFLLSPRLSTDARILAVAIAVANAREEPVVRADLKKTLGVGSERFRRAKQSLEKAGYLTTRPGAKADGPWIWEITT